MKDKTGKVITAIGLASLIGMCGKPMVASCLTGIARSEQRMEIPKLGTHCGDQAIEIKLERYFDHLSVRIWDHDGVYTPQTWSGGERRVSFLMLESPRWENQFGWHIRNLVPLSKHEESTEGCSYHLDTVFDKIKEELGLHMYIAYPPYRW